MARLLITGGSGDLGRSLCRQAVEAGHTVTATYLTRPERIAAGTPLQLDLTDRDAVAAALDATQPECIIHTAMPPMNAPNLRQSIISGAWHLSKLCPRSTRLIFFSTDLVFDGTASPYAENAPPSPLSAYGTAKAEMELMSDYVIRTSLIYDFKPGNKQVDWMLDKIARREPLRLFTDEIRCPIWVENLAEATLELAESPSFKGILHVASPEPVSRVVLGQRILEAVGWGDYDLIEQASVTATGRPGNLILDVSKAQLLLKTPLLTVDQAFNAWKDARPS